MRLSLKLHPDYICAAANSIEVDAIRPRPGQLELRYLVHGGVAGLSVAPEAAPARTDELWRRTCFEVFVRATPDAAYHEFNFAPSRQWAAYRFQGHRSGMSDVAIVPPLIDTRATTSCYELRTSLNLEGLPDLPADAPWTVGLSAVIEEAGGRKSYWALAHPPGGADFHHRDCFAHQLEAPDAT